MCRRIPSFFYCQSNRKWCVLQDSEGSLNWLQNNRMKWGSWCKLIWIRNLNKHMGKNQWKILSPTWALKTFEVSSRKCIKIYHQTKLEVQPMDSDSEFGTQSDFYAGDLILRISYVRETEWLNLAEFPIQLRIDSLFNLVIESLSWTRNLFISGALN